MSGGGNGIFRKLAEHGRNFGSSKLNLILEDFPDDVEVQRGWLCGQNTATFDCRAAILPTSGGKAM